jgi:DNA-binding transcriptional regulator YdaS (Cro superfamily)
MTPPVNPVAALEAYVDQFPSQTVAAKRLGVSPAFVSQMLTGRSGIPAWVLDALGLKTVVVAK